MKYAHSDDVQSLVVRAREILSDAQHELAEISDIVNDSMKGVESSVEALSSTFNPYVNIESVPGVRTPKWYSVEIDFTSGESQSKSRAIEVSTEGAFVLHSMMCAYLILDESPTHYARYRSAFSNVELPVGRNIPSSIFPLTSVGAFNNLVFSAPTTPISNSSSATLANSQYEYPEFSVGLELESAGVQLTERPIPSGLIYTLENPLYFSSLCYVDRGERLIVTARPDARVPLTGKFRFFVHGYQVLGDIDTKALRRLR